MKKITYIFLLLVSMASTSCLTAFDPDFTETPVIYLEAFPGKDADKVEFKIQPGYSRSNTPEILPFKPEIIFEVNGTVIPVECLDVDGGYYVAAYTPVPGDKLSVSVSSEGFTSIHAQTSIPEAFPERKIDYRQVQSGLNEYDNVLFVTFSGADPKCSYGMYIWSETEYYLESGTEVYTYAYSGEIYPDPSDAAFGIVPASLEAIELHFDNAWFWTWEGKKLDPQSCTLSIEPKAYRYGHELSYESFFGTYGETEIYDDEEYVKHKVQYFEHNKIMLVTMSEEFYKYQVAQQLEGDYSGLLGFIAPSSYCYSNINNGYGAFAGVSIIETDWITKEFIENNR